MNVEEISDVDTFRVTFFPEGFGAKNAGLTVTPRPHCKILYIKSKNVVFSYDFIVIIYLS